MITPTSRPGVSLFSLAVALTTMLALGACARAPAPVTWNDALVTAEGPPAIVFVNEAESYVDVYLVGERREWWLGRVQPGARVTLRVRDEALTESGFMRLAVLAGAQRTLQVSQNPRATFTIAQPATQVISQRWTFRQTQLAEPEIFGVRAKLGRD